MTYRTCRCLTLGLVLAGLAGTGGWAQDLGDTVYTRYNLHYYGVAERGSKKLELRAANANYLEAGNHGVLPYNTKVTLAMWRGGFLIKVDGTEQEINFTYRADHMANMSLEDYLKLIFSKDNVTYPDLSEKDEEGIKAGKADFGMTKQGVTIALGYPAKHKTSSLEEDTWFYWRTMFRTMSVHFKNGKVIGVK